MEAFGDYRALFADRQRNEKVRNGTRIHLEIPTGHPRPGECACAAEGRGVSSFDRNRERPAVGVDEPNILEDVFGDAETLCLIVLGEGSSLNGWCRCG
jgi:hypothetical protein